MHLSTSKAYWNQFDTKKVDRAQVYDKASNRTGLAGDRLHRALGYWPLNSLPAPRLKLIPTAVHPRKLTIDLATRFPAAFVLRPRDRG